MYFSFYPVKFFSTPFLGLSIKSAAVAPMQLEFFIFFILTSKTLKNIK